MEPVRFREPWEQAASLRLRDGDATVLAEYDEHARMIGGEPEEMLNAAATAYVALAADGTDAGPLHLPSHASHPAPYLGPPTETQLVALRSLEGIAIRQASPAPDGIIGDASRSARVGFPWQLVAVLVVQAALSLRLLWSNTVFIDEAEYLWAGHLEWAHWLQGAPVPAFQTWFSGAPVLYPALAALVDTYGGLTAVRLLGLAFMLGVTCLLWGTTSRLVSRRAALVATALFGTLAGTAFLGAFATYDAMALFLLAAGTRIGVGASQRGRALGSVGFLLAGVILGLACAVKYAAALFVPVILFVVFFSRAREAGWGRAVAAFLTVAIALALALTAGLYVGGSAYWHGLQETTLSRAASDASPLSVIKMSYIWTASIAILALAALFMSRREPPAYKWLLRLLAITILLVPAEQARIGTMISLHKHVVFGAWFAAIAAGYVLGRLSMVDRTRGWMIVMSIPIIAAALIGTIPQSTSLYEAWPNVSAFSAGFPQVLARHPGTYLSGDKIRLPIGYYSKGRVAWNQWQNDRNFRQPGMSPGLASDRFAITGHEFALVIVNTNASSSDPYDAALLNDIRQSRGYRLVASADGFEAWSPPEQ
jgi:Dolichyl-phosphate-mannose-protein mannosyltransferase